VWWAWPLGLGTAVLVLLFASPAAVIDPNLSTTGSIPGESRPKGARSALAVYRRTDRGSETMADGAIARAGDLLRLGYAPVTQAYGVILSVDGRGGVTRHPPATGPPPAGLRRDPFRRRPGRGHETPAGERRPRRASRTRSHEPAGCRV